MSARPIGAAIVLAAGRGSRMARLVPTMITGEPLPKQFCSFGGNGSLLQGTVGRLLPLVEPDKISVVVSLDHALRARAQLADVPCRLFAQPCSRGTAIAAALAVSEITLTDPHAAVLVVPADLTFRRARHFHQFVGRAAARVAERPERLVILGTSAHARSPDAGWMVLHPPEGGSQRVACFVAASSDAAASRLVELGGAWSTLVVVGVATVLLRAIEDAAGCRLDRAHAQARYREYHSLPHVDLFRAIALHDDVHAIVASRRAGLVDVDTPEEVEAALGKTSAIS